MKINLKKTLLILFCTVFFGANAFFSLGMLIPGASAAAEGVTAPRFLKDGKISDSFGTDAETWFSRRFAYRGTMVNTFAKIKERLFSTGNEQVIVGRGGFLFFAETLDCYTGASPMTEEEINAAADALSALSAYASDHGADFLFVCAPDKNTVYPEYMPARYKQSAEPSDLDHLHAALEERGIPYLDLRPILYAAKDEGLLYHKRDTHWNGRGSRTAFLSIMEALDRPVPQTLFVPLTEAVDFNGDLDSLMYPKGASPDENAYYDVSALYAYTSAFSTPMDMQITTRSAGDAGRLLFFRDSFGNALLGDFAATFRTMRMERAIPYRIDLLENEREQADVVLVMIVERNLRSLIGCDARIRDENE